MALFIKHRSRRLPATQRPQRISLSTSNYQLSTSPAFTLIEILIVLAIIALIVGLGVPLFGVLTGAKSVEAGRNIVAATIGQARTVAVNEGRYAGVMFYVDPATERTAMSIVIVTDPSSSLEDPDPYDKYKAWVAGEDYFSGKLDAGQAFPARADRTIDLAVDADATYRGPLYPSVPLVSDYLKLFGNYRPVVRNYRCLTSHTQAVNQVGGRPPRNGPYLDPTQGKIHNGLPVNALGQPYPQTLESVNGPFANTLWGLDDQTAVSRFSTGEQTLLPRGVGVQLLITPQISPGSTGSERYLSTGVIMFDPQGRLVLRDFSLDSSDTLGQYIQLAPNTVARHVVSGIGLAIYDSTQFKAGQFSIADTRYQKRTAVPSNDDYAIQSPTNPAFNDYPLPSSQNPNASYNDPSNANTNEAAEESWLDANATPLIINRYTGSMSEAQ